MPASRRMTLWLLSITLASACGGEDRGITQPTPPSPFSIHNTLNAPDNLSPLDLEYSFPHSSGIPMIDNLAPYVWDDFTSAASAAIRAVSWQGGHCRAPNAGSNGPPAAVGTFHVSFYADNNGRPSFIGTDLYRVTLTAAEAHEQFALEARGRDYLRNEADCTYYDYTAVLPNLFPVTAGTRYWLLIRRGDGVGPWGWRVGRQDNGMSARGSQRLGDLSILPKDLAFSLSSP